MTAAGIIFVVGLLFMFALRQRYDSPLGHRQHGGPVDDAARHAAARRWPAPSLRTAAITLQHAMATLFALADRGVVTITEEPRKWGQRNFTLHRRQTNQPLAPEETAVLNLAFRHKGARKTPSP